MTVKLTQPEKFLHQLPIFTELLNQLAESLSIDAYLIEKDYWLMHCLWGLQQQGWRFELKGGTSLSKGHGIIQRFSEDIDIRFEPPTDHAPKTGKNHVRPHHIAARKTFFDGLAAAINIPGLSNVARDTDYDDEIYRNAGIVLLYPVLTQFMPGIKEGILLEVGFDTTTPNVPQTISSWSLDAALKAKLAVIDNRAVDVPCYSMGYTFVEKLQTVSTKFRKQQETGRFGKNFLRHYYDLYCLLASPEVQAFIGTADYHTHKQRRFPKADNLHIASNDAFLLRDPAIRTLYETQYRNTSALYYAGQVPFAAILDRIRHYSDRL
jgi:hypothetical protein